MSPTIQDLGIDRMSADDRLRLIEEIWESLSPADTLEIPESHREELDRRLAAADADTSGGSPWEEARAAKGWQVSLPLTVRPEAEQDMAEARDWYEARPDGLGGAFLSAVEDVFARIRTFPQL